MTDEAEFFTVPLTEYDGHGNAFGFPGGWYWVCNCEDCKTAPLRTFVGPYETQAAAEDNVGSFDRASYRIDMVLEHRGGRQAVRGSPRSVRHRCRPTEGEGDPIFCEIEFTLEGDPPDDIGLYIRVNDERVARRGEPGSNQARSWVSMRPGIEVIDTGDGEFVMFQDGERVH